MGLLHRAERRCSVHADRGGVRTLGDRDRIRALRIVHGAARRLLRTICRIRRAVGGDRRASCRCCRALRLDRKIRTEGVLDRAARRITRALGWERGAKGVLDRADRLRHDQLTSRRHVRTDRRLVGGTFRPLFRALRRLLRAEGRTLWANRLVHRAFRLGSRAFRFDPRANRRRLEGGDRANRLHPRALGLLPGALCRPVAGALREHDRADRRLVNAVGYLSRTLRELIGADRLASERTGTDRGRRRIIRTCRVLSRTSRRDRRQQTGCRPLREECRTGADHG